MRKFIYLIAITFLFSSCSKTVEESYFIPKDAIGVMYINLENLSKKSKKLDFNNLTINSLIKDKAPKELKQFTNKLMSSENLNNTFRKDYILGFTTYKRLSAVGGVILPIKDAASFENFIKPMLDKVPNIEKETNVGKNEAFTVYSTRELAIGFNDKTALIIGANKYAAAELKDLTNLDKEDCILSTSYYNSFFDTDQDIGLHITSTPLGDAFDGLLNAYAGLDIDLENNNLTYYGSFEDDHIHTDTKLKLNKDIKSLIGYDKWIKTSYNRSMLNALPNNPILVAKLSLDTQNLFQHIVNLEENRILPVEVREELKKNIKRANREFQKDIGMDIKDFTKIFEGSLLFAMTKGISTKDTVYSYNYYNRKENFKIVTKNTPYIYSTIALNDRAKFDRLFSKIKEKNSDIKEISKDYYQIESDIFMVINGDFIFFTNNANKADEVKNNGKLASNLSDFKHKDKFAHPLYLYTKENFAEFSDDFSKDLNKIINPYNRYRSYQNNDAIDELSEKSGVLYSKYFGDNHYFIDTDGAESFTYTKGDKNSLIQTILYGDELSKIMSDIED